MTLKQNQSEFFNGLATDFFFMLRAQYNMCFVQRKLHSAPTIYIYIYSLFYGRIIISSSRLFNEKKVK